MSRRIEILAAGIGLVASAAYGLTIHEWLYWGDSAELALQSGRLGLTHPPGYPLYCLLAHLAGSVVGDAAQGTVLLSLVMTVLTAVFLARLVASIAGPIPAIVAAVAYAAHPEVWLSAVRTEVYNVNTAVFFGAVLALIWPGNITRRRSAAACITFAASLGTSPANALLLPGFVVALFSRNGREARFRYAVLACSLALTGLVIGLWTMHRANMFPPLGTTNVPNTVADFASYVTGADYGIFKLHNARFYVGRTLDQLLAWLKAYAWFGAPIGVSGVAWMLTRERRPVAIGLVLMLLGNVVYFTYHRFPDYRTMMGASYAIFAIAVGLGFHVLQQRVHRSLVAVLATVLLIAMGVTSVRHLEDRQVPGSAQDFVDRAFEVLPEDALVVTRWTYFTPLLYAQQIDRRRPDLQIIELAYGPRQYEHVRVSHWTTWAVTQAGKRPIVTNEAIAERETAWKRTRLAGGWFKLNLPSRP